MKAILVIDMPRSCAECTLRTSLEANHLYCVATLPRLKIDPMTASHIKEHKCPLKPMPERKEVHYTDPLFGEVENLTNIGYNKCLDDLGETE